MKTSQALSLGLAIVLANGAFSGAAQAGSISLKPGQYETREESADGSQKPDVDTDCISPEEAKDVVKYLQDQSSEESCKLTDSRLDGKSFTGQSVCKGGGDKPFTSMQVKSKLKFTETGYSGTVLENGTGTDGKPFEKKLNISVKRTGECNAQPVAARG